MSTSISRYHRHITVAKPGDLTIEIIEHDKNPNGRTEDGSASKITASIRVDKARLEEFSDYFLAMFGGLWIESQTDTIILKGDTVLSMEVWLRRFHDALRPLPHGKVTLEEIWNIVKASDKYNFDPKLLNGWFNRWYAAPHQQSRGDVMFNRELLLLCQIFDCARGFKDATRYLVYNHSNPIPGFTSIHLDGRRPSAQVIQLLNKAKNILQMELECKLRTEINNTLKLAECNCEVETVFQHLKELSGIKNASRSDTQLTKGLGHFDAASMLGALEYRCALARLMKPPTFCKRCSANWGKIIASAQIAERYFHGLCLDCMDSIEDVSMEGCMDYMNSTHEYEYFLVDMNCRIHHGEASWHFSFIGGIKHGARGPLTRGVVDI